MKFAFEYDRPSDAPFVEMVWTTQTIGGGSFISSASSKLEFVFTKQQDNITLSVRGPETLASTAPVPEDADFLGITFKHGTFIPHLPAADLINGGIHLAQSNNRTFQLQGSAWEFPTFENIDTFVTRLVRQGLIAHEPIVEAALKGQLKNISERSVQRRFIRATGIPHATIYQIERARKAMALLKQGHSILDTVDEAGYSDQPHLTRSLKHFIGQTPAQILNTMNDE